MDEKDLQNEIEKLTGISQELLDQAEKAYSATWTWTDPDIDSGALAFPPPRENPPEDPLMDLMTANLASHYIIDRISRADLIQRVMKIWPNAGGLDLSEFLDKLDRDKDEYWKKVRGEKPIGK